MNPHVELALGTYWYRSRPSCHLLSLSHGPGAYTVDAVLLQSGPRCRTLVALSQLGQTSLWKGFTYALPIFRAVGLNFCTSGCLHVYVSLVSKYLWRDIGGAIAERRAHRIPVASEDSTHVDKCEGMKGRRSVKRANRKKGVALIWPQDDSKQFLESLQRSARGCPTRSNPRTRHARTAIARRFFDNDHYHADAGIIFMTHLQAQAKIRGSNPCCCMAREKVTSDMRGWMLA